MWDKNRTFLQNLGGNFMVWSSLILFDYAGYVKERRMFEEDTQENQRQKDDREMKIRVANLPRPTISELRRSIGEITNAR